MGYSTRTLIHTSRNTKLISKSKRKRSYKPVKLTTLLMIVLFVVNLLLAYSISRQSRLSATGANNAEQPHNSQHVVVKQKEDESKFDEKVAKKIVAAGVGKFEMLQSDQIEAKRQTTAISLVISHCEESVDWIPLYLGDKYKIKDIIIYSKCGQEVKGISSLTKLAPTEVVRLVNVGRCDHSYAYWIKEHYHKIDREKDGEDIVFFLKDNSRFQEEFHTIDDIFTLSSEIGFGCLYKPQYGCCTECSRSEVEPLMMHGRKYLITFSLDVYSRMMRDKLSDFLSERYKNLESWNDAMGFQIPKSETIPVCYLGMFAAKKKQIFNQPAYAWERMTNSLSRANNIIEGHYAERMWASLLSNQDERYLQELDRVMLPKVTTMTTRPSDSSDENKCGMQGLYYVKKGETYDNYFN